MTKAIIGEKIGITRIFTEDGCMVPVTVIKAGPCVVSCKKNIEKDGYSAVQLGYGKIKEESVKKPQLVSFEKSKIGPVKILREFKLSDSENLNIGDFIKVNVFSVGECVDVTGTSKGKGWAGVIKRWNFRRLRESHGTGPVSRHGGSIGQCSDPSRVYKGLRSAGHLGHERVTVQNLKIVKIVEDENLIAIKGSVPGPKGSIVYIKNTVKKNKNKKEGK
ncbi:MAG: 50S ribosomal protein L3 [Clostridia bacterium]|nr:50S ribosomal protein L3 [Clostridia bacterium]